MKNHLNNALSLQLVKLQSLWHLVHRWDFLKSVFIFSACKKSVVRNPAIIEFLGACVCIWYLLWFEVYDPIQAMAAYQERSYAPFILSIRQIFSFYGIYNASRFLFKQEYLYIINYYCLSILHKKKGGITTEEEEERSKGQSDVWGFRPQFRTVQTHMSRLIDVTGSKLHTC